MHRTLIGYFLFIFVQFVVSCHWCFVWGA